MSKLCDECETVAYCLKNGCIPEQPAYRAVKTYHEGKPVYVAEQPASTLEELYALSREVSAEQPAQQEPVAYISGEYIILAKHWTEDNPPLGWLKLVFQTSPAQRKPLNLDELKALWNSQAEHMNQWDELGIDEIVAFAQADHTSKENT